MTTYTAAWFHFLTTRSLSTLKLSQHIVENGGRDVVMKTMANFADDQDLQKRVRVQVLHPIGPRQRTLTLRVLSVVHPARGYCVPLPCSPRPPPPSLTPPTNPDPTQGDELIQSMLGHSVEIAFRQLETIRQTLVFCGHCRPWFQEKGEPARSRRRRHRRRHRRHGCRRSHSVYPAPCTRPSQGCY